MIVVSDNGASAEGGAEGSINDVRLTNLDPAGRDEMVDRMDEIGGPSTHNNYPWGWTMAGNTPFKRWKREVHQGGVADPCIVSWPRGVRGGLIGRRGPAPVHPRDRRAADGARAGRLVDGCRPRSTESRRARSMGRASRTCCAAPERVWPSGTRRSTSRCSDLGRSTTGAGRRSTFHPVGPLYDDGRDPNAPFDDDVWELYHVAEDLSESDDLAGRAAGTAGRTGRAVVAGGRRNQVLPLDNRVLWALVNPKPDHRRPRGLPVFPRRRPGARVGRGQRSKPVARAGRST